MVQANLQGFKIATAELLATAKNLEEQVALVQEPYVEKSSVLN